MVPRPVRVTRTSPSAAGQSAAGRGVVMKPISEGHALRRLFKGLIDNAFCVEIGVCDPDLTDYIADLLVGFVHMDALHALRGLDGARLSDLAAMLDAVTGLDTQAGRGDRLRMYRHVGDFTLFWSGVYPECLGRRRGLVGRDRLLDYVAQGKRSYDIASQLAGEDAAPPASLLSRLSAEFEFCCHGLGLVRRGWEETDPHGAGRVRTLLY